MEVRSIEVLLMNWCIFFKSVFLYRSYYKAKKVQEKHGYFASVPKPTTIRDKLDPAATLDFWDVDSVDEQKS